MSSQNLLKKIETRKSKAAKKAKPAKAGNKSMADQVSIDEKKNAKKAKTANGVKEVVFADDGSLHEAGPGDVKKQRAGFIVKQKKAKAPKKPKVVRKSDNTVKVDFSKKPKKK